MYVCSCCSHPFTKKLGSIRTLLLMTLLRQLIWWCHSELEINKKSTIIYLKNFFVVIGTTCRILGKMGWSNFFLPNYYLITLFFWKSNTQKLQQKFKNDKNKGLFNMSSTDFLDFEIISDFVYPFNHYSYLLDKWRSYIFDCNTNYTYYMNKGFVHLKCKLMFQSNNFRWYFYRFL